MRRLTDVDYDKMKLDETSFRGRHFIYIKQESNIFNITTEYVSRRGIVDMFAYYDQITPEFVFESREEALEFIDEHIDINRIYI